MILAYFIVIVCSAAAWWLVKKYLDSTENGKEITRIEYISGLLIIAIVIPFVMYGMRSSFIYQKTTFNEWWNWWEIATDKKVVQCERDGSCVHDYSCDPYVVMVQHCTTDSKGNQSCHNDPETRYHSCPYSDEEWSFYVTTTLGKFAIGEDRFPNNPERHIWRVGEPIPTYVLSDAGQGVPVFWQSAKDRIDSGKPGPVTKRMQYVNYILASDRTILKQYADIEKYKAAGLLPSLSSSVISIPDDQESYLAEKVYFVGINPPNKQDWFDTLNRLNAGFGSELQGDVHLVIANSKAIENIDKYFFALKAYWQSPQVFGKDALSKNAVLILVTVNGDKVDRARVSTGMPVWNEPMVTALQSRLAGSLFDPKAVLGTVNGGAKVKHGTWVVESVLWGLDDKSTQFKRVCMGCVNEDGVWFSYLLKEVTLDNGDIVSIAIFAFFISMLVWVSFALIGDKYTYPWR